VKVSDNEDVASRIGPESWRGVREGVLQALTGENAGWVLSREISLFQGADGVPMHGRQHRTRRNRESCSDPARSKTPCTRGNILHGTQEIPPLALPRRHGPRGESVRRKSAMNGGGKSDKPVVPGKDANKGCGEPRPAECLEERGLTKGNLGRQPSSGLRAR
jgi:hypothetical protein